MTTNEKESERKKMIFNAMSPRRQKYITNKIGYDKWNPFAEPKDPIDMRMDKTKRTSQMLFRDFLATVNLDEHGDDYMKGAFDICMGVINDDEKYKGMLDFAVWYTDELKKQEK